MHEAALARAARPTPAVILGLPLKPYSLGHELSLIRENNPLHELDTASAGQLAEAVWICSCSWKELSGSDWLIGLKLWIWRQRMRLRKFEFDKELANFIVYRQLGSIEFPIAEAVSTSGAVESQPRTPGAPFLLRLQQFLMIQFRLSENQAWDYPLGMAKLRWCAFWEEQAGLKIYNREDAAHDAFVMEQEALGKEQLEAKQNG